MNLQKFKICVSMRSLTCLGFRVRACVEEHFNKGLGFTVEGNKSRTSKASKHPS